MRMNGYRRFCGRRFAVCSLLLFLIICILFALILIEELNFGIGYLAYMNSYSKVVTFEPREIIKGRHKVSIAVIVKDHDISEYALAQETVRCYAEMYGYHLHLIKLSEVPKIVEKCGSHEDFMFLRHCVLSLSMSDWPKNEWVLFADADMGIINPSHRIEDFLPRDESIFIVFYKRIMNHELMAGSYLIKSVTFNKSKTNNEQGRLFLQFWANYEHRLPKSFHGSDNGAIHSVVAEWSLPKLTESRKSCESWWNNSRNFDDLYTYEACIQNIFDHNPPPGVKILKKGRFAWARDGWLTENLWSETDFLLHGWQRKRLDRLGFGRWHSPLVWDEGQPWKDCHGKDGWKNWRYKDSFVSSRLETDRRIQKVIDEMNSDYIQRLEHLPRDLPH